MPRRKRGKRKAKAKDNEPPATQELVPAEPQLERRVDEFPVTNKLRFTLNGQLIEVENPDPQQLLVHWLRESGYTGTKVKQNDRRTCTDSRVANCSSLPNIINTFRAPTAVSFRR